MSILMLLSVAITATLVLMGLGKILNKPGSTGEKALKAYLAEVEG